MALLEINSLTKSYGADTVFEHVTLSVESRHRVGFVGRNGTGKTTLLRIIAGIEDYDAGSVTIAPGHTVGYIAQGKGYTSGNTLYEEMLSAFHGASKVAEEMRELEHKMADADVIARESVLADVMRRYSNLSEEFERLGGYDHDVRIKSTLFGLGFCEDDLGRVVDTLSGGQKVRVALARMLVSDPDLLLLDEPTNHLDTDACEWLEDYLKSFRGAFIVVSHDRYFLDATIDRVWDLDRGAISEYPGNYTFFVAQKELARRKQAEDYARQQERIHKLEEYVRRYMAGNRTTMAQSRQKMLARIERIQKPTDGPSLKLSFGKAVRTGKLALVASKVSKAYGGRRLFEGVDLAIERGERLGIVGPNGSGKTTFLRILARDLAPDSGSVAYGENVSVGIFWQDLGGLDDNSTVLDEVYRIRDWTMGEARSYLARFLFTGDDVFKQVKVLSGGERNRLILAVLILSGPNVLLLDEPTNHLDIESRHGLEQALSEFDGTVVCASHDRYFLDQIATSILEIASGGWKLYDGNYSYYRMKKEQERAANAASAPALASGPAGSRGSRGSFRSGASGVSGASDGARGVARGVGGRPGTPGDAGGGRAKRRSRAALGAAEAEAKRIEAELEEAEERLAQIEAELASEDLYAEGGDRAREVVQEHGRVQDRIQALYEAWETALQALEDMKGCEE